MNLNLDSYAGLQEAIADYLNRQDLLDTIPTFIRLAETDFNRRIRHPKMLKQVQAVVHNSYIPLPADLVQIFSLDIPGTSRPIAEFVSPDDFRQLAHHRDKRQTHWYTVVANQIQFLPEPGVEGLTVNLTYYAKIEQLSNINQNNWLLTDWPDAYLFGSLMQAQPYLQDDNRLATWGTVLGGLMEAIRIANDEARFSATSLVIRARPF